MSFFKNIFTSLLKIHSSFFIFLFSKYFKFMNSKIVDFKIRCDRICRILSNFGKIRRICYPCARQPRTKKATDGKKGEKEQGEERERSLHSPRRESTELPRATRDRGAQDLLVRVLSGGPPAMASPRSAGTGSMGDEAIWRKLREAGFDEDAVRRRDKATLVAYITRLETEAIPLSPFCHLVRRMRRVLVSWLGAVVLGVPE
jgi:hypothetical protein